MISVQQLIGACRRAIYGTDVETHPCWRCDDHGVIAIYSTSDEYGAPCPVCKGPDAFHRKIEAREGCIPSELRWTPEREAMERPS